MPRVPISEFGAGPDWTAEAEWLADSIWFTIAYIDRVVIWTRGRMSKEVQAALRRHCTRAFPDRKHPPSWRAFAETWVILQPSYRALRDLHDALGERGYKLVGVEFTLDLIVGTAEEKARLARFIGVCWTQLRPPNSAPDSGGAVAYSAHQFLKFEWVTDDGEIKDGLRPTRRRHGRYSDSPSKPMNDEHCVHLEVKFQTADACQLAGAGSLADLTMIDHLALWRRHLTLRWIVPAILARIVATEEQRAKGVAPRRGRTRSATAKRDDVDGRRLLAAMPTLVGSKGWKAPTGNVDAVKAYMRQHYPGVRLDRALVVIPNAGFLPQHVAEFRYRDGRRLVNVNSTPIISAVRKTQS